MRAGTWIVAVIASVMAVTSIAVSQSSRQIGEWRSIGGDPGFQRYSALDQIRKDNVSRLAIAWRRPAIDRSLTAGGDVPYSHDFRSTPLMIDGVLYASNGIGLVEAFDPGTGRTRWVQQPYADEPDRGLRGASTRGVSYWADGDTKQLFVIRGEYLIALDPSTGRPVTRFGEDGRVNLRAGLGPRATVYSSNSGPQLCGDVVIAGGWMTDAPQSKEQAPGNVQAFDARTGRPRWSFHVVPRPGEIGNDTWENDSWAYTGQANLWAMASADESLGLAYLPLSSATNDMYGGHRPGANLFANSLVAVKCATGERVWHYQSTLR